MKIILSVGLLLLSTAGFSCHTSGSCTVTDALEYKRFFQSECSLQTLGVVPEPDRPDWRAPHWLNVYIFTNVANSASLPTLREYKSWHLSEGTLNPSLTSRFDQMPYNSEVFEGDLHSWVTLKDFTKADVLALMGAMGLKFSSPDDLLRLKLIGIRSSTKDRNHNGEIKDEMSIVNGDNYPFGFETKVIPGNVGTFRREYDFKLPPERDHGVTFRLQMECKTQEIQVGDVD
ncbi:MAG: hypothetical protein AB7T49_17690 [Oligoflexales bacterium]